MKKTALNSLLNNNIRILCKNNKLKTYKSLLMNQRRFILVKSLLVNKLIILYLHKPLQTLLQMEFSSKEDGHKRSTKSFWRVLESLVETGDKLKVILEVQELVLKSEVMLKNILTNFTKRMILIMMSEISSFQILLRHCQL
jgi:hypothetical protein